MDGDNTSIVDLRQKASMDNWWPRLTGVDVPTPETRKIKIREWDTATQFYEGVPMDDVPMDELVSCIEDVSGPPAFLRTDQASAKHFMAKASCVNSTDEGDVWDYVFELLNHNELAGLFGLPWKSLFVREWLDLDAEFTAFRGTPIAPEIRFFLLDGEVMQDGFYWPEDAINRPDKDDWRDRHVDLRRKAYRDDLFDGARFYAKRVSEEFEDGYWSVDFALTADDGWYCLDMAPGEISWHPDGCEKLVDPPEPMNAD